MTLPVPLTVRLSTDRFDRHITADLRDLTFRSVVPGGFASAQMSFNNPLSEDIAYYANVDIYDQRNGNTVWCGRLEDPGRSVSAEGQVWDLAAVGPSAHLQDRTIPLIYVDRSLTEWEKLRNASGERQNAQVATAEDPGGSGLDALTVSFPVGMTIPTNASCTATYWPLVNCDQDLAVFDYSWDCGITNASWRIHGLSSPTNIVRDQSATTAGGGNSTSVVGITFSLGDAQPILRMSWDSASSSTGASDDVWTAFREIIVRAITYDQDGTQQTSGYTSVDRDILASTVVADLLGRLLDQFDGANAVIDTTTYEIDQLAYPDGVTAAQVLDDLALLEPGYYFAAWDRDDGGFRAEYVAWPTEVAYEATVEDGYSSTGTAQGLYNRVRVRWKDPKGRVRTTSRTQTVDALTAAGLTREGFVDLADNLGSSTNAIQVGDQFLADHAAPINEGRLVVARPIYDHTRGMKIEPWEIRPGKLIRVNGIQAHSDSLNATSRDGVTVFKVVGVNYDTSSSAATLELDSQPTTLSHLLAKLGRKALSAERYRKR